MRILVTGKDGQLGRSIFKLVNAELKIGKNICSNDFTFVGRDNLDFSSESSIKNFFNNNGKFNVIINCAAFTAVDRAEENYGLANQINHLAVKQLANICKKQQSKLIHVSTDYVFDGEKDDPYIELDITNPVNVYGNTKLAGERAVQEVMPTDAVIIRTSWVYSEYGRNFVNTMLSLGQERAELNVVSDQFGSPTFATDLANVILEIKNRMTLNVSDNMTQVYHYSNEGEISWYDFAKEMFKIAKINCNIFPIKTYQYPLPAKRPKNTTMNKDKILKMDNIESIDWKFSLTVCINLINIKI